MSPQIPETFSPLDSDRAAREARAAGGRTLAQADPHLPCPVSVQRRDPWRRRVEEGGGLCLTAWEASHLGLELRTAGAQLFHEGHGAVRDARQGTSLCEPATDERHGLMGADPAHVADRRP